jgi:hypothetical protein
MTSQIPLVYIASNGHSGSTLLDLLLGAHPNIWTLGEAQNLPWELRNPRAPCGCGTPVEDDDFWKPLLDDIPLDIEGYHIGYFRNIAQVGKVLRWDLLPDVFRNEISDEWRPAVQEYGESNFRYFNVVREAAEDRTGERIQWLVDNSKDPYRLFWLHHSGYFRTRVIHLVKDPRAFVYSMVKGYDSPPWSAILRYTARWIIENMIISRVAEKGVFDENVFHLTYEQLARAPKETMDNVTAWLDVDDGQDLTDGFRNYENHALSGNMMRWRQSENSIQLDERWKTNLSPAVKEFVSTVTRPFVRACGYRP